MPLYANDFVISRSGYSALSHGADSTLRGDGNLWTPLLITAIFRQAKVSRITWTRMPGIPSVGIITQSVERRANQRRSMVAVTRVGVNALDDNCFTALHLASGKSELEVMCLLLKSRNML